MIKPVPQASQGGFLTTGATREVPVLFSVYELQSSLFVVYGSEGFGEHLAADAPSQHHTLLCLSGSPSLFFKSEVIY